MEASNSLDPVYEVMGTVAMYLGMFAIVVGVGQFAWSTYSGYPSRGGATIGGGILLALGGAWILPALAQAAKSAAEQENAPEKPLTDPQMPDIDWSLVGWIAGGVVGLAVVVIAVVYVATAVRRGRSLDAAERDRLDRIWSESVARHDRLREEWLSFQQDFEKVLSFPLLTDVAEPRTAAFIDALGKATDLSADARPNSSDVVERYAQATRAAETKWHAALHHAERVRLARFAPGERDRIRKVQRLLRHAMNGGTAPEERRAYYERARDLLGDLIPLPEPARVALEQSVRGELVVTKPVAKWPSYSPPSSRVAEPSRKQRPEAALDVESAAASQAAWTTYGLTAGTDFGGRLRCQRIL